MPASDQSTLADALDHKLSTTSNLDSSWVNVVRDHLDYLKQRSHRLTISDHERSQFRYKFEFFLRERGVDQNLFWIVRLINRLDKFADFSTLNEIMVPVKSDVTELYRRYQTSKKQQEIHL